jgi:hypothetical protein
MSAAKTWTRDEINDILKSNPRAVERAMVRLFELQTESEKESSTTRNNNGVGFSSYAASSGSYYARWVISGRQLSGKHLETALKIALRHSRQLVDHANKAS